MRSNLITSLLLLVVVSCATPDAGLQYPETQRGEVVEDLHGTAVADPYRWMEDLDSDQVQAWVKAQNEVTFAYLGSIPGRDKIKARLTELWNYERYGTPRKVGDRYFYSRNDGLQNQSVLYVSDSLEGEPRVLLDPNGLSSDGTVALTGTQISPDGKHLAYGTSSGGSDWQEWHLKSVETGEPLDDHLKWIKFSGASWAPDGSGFYYSRYDAPAEGEKMEGVNINQKVFFHKVGTDQSADTLVYERPDQPKWGFGARVSDDGRYLILSVRTGTDTRNRVFYQDLRGRSAKAIELLNDFDASYQFVGNNGPVFWVQTDLEAPRSRIIAIDTTKPAREHWTTLVPESEATLQSVSALKANLILSYLKDAKSHVEVRDYEGELVGEIALPGTGSASGFDGTQSDDETFYRFSSYTDPGSIYRLKLVSRQLGDGVTSSTESALFKRPELAFDPEQYETKQVFFESKDGTRVPMFISHKKGLALTGDNPTLLYGYGGFNISLTPRFSVSNLVWMEMGGVYAVPNLRGGGEYGEEWHQGGMKQNKQNVFDDFIAAAEWLIENDYTQTSRLAISGGSNGGLLVGAAMTQRPDLFGATLPAVGVMDMLRFHKFTIGWAWVSDYGSPDEAEAFGALYAYSPYHNLKEGVSYPPTLVTTADHDDRVVPSHSFKFAAALQHAHAGPNPVLIRIATRAGHGAGKPTSMRIEEAADQFAFLTRSLGME